MDFLGQNMSEMVHFRKVGDFFFFGQFFFYGQIWWWKKCCPWFFQSRPFLTYFGPKSWFPLFKSSTNVNVRQEMHLLADRYKKVPKLIQNRLSYLTFTFVEIFCYGNQLFGPKIVTVFFFNIYNCLISNSEKGIDCAMIT